MVSFKDLDIYLNFTHMSTMSCRDKGLTVNHFRAIISTFVSCKKCVSQRYKYILGKTLSSNSKIWNLNKKSTLW